VYFAPLERYGVRLAARYLVETLATPVRPEIASAVSGVSPSWR